MLIEKGMFPNRKYFSYVSVIVWGIVMYLFERDKKTLQPSLSSSMTFLYHDSDRMDRGWRDFVPIEMPAFMDKKPIVNTESAGNM